MPMPRFQIEWSFKEQSKYENKFLKNNKKKIEKEEKPAT